MLIYSISINRPIDIFLRYILLCIRIHIKETYMGKTTVVIDETLINEVIRVTNLKTKKRSH